jgi:hypothetical protein
VETNDFKLTRTNAEGEEIIIEQKTPTMSMKTLGGNDAPSGGNVAPRVSVKQIQGMDQQDEKRSPPKPDSMDGL